MNNKQEEILRLQAESVLSQISNSGEFSFCIMRKHMFTYTCTHNITKPFGFLNHSMLFPYLYLNFISLISVTISSSINSLFFRKKTWNKKKMFQAIYDMVLFLEPKFSAISLWTSTSFLGKTRLEFPKPKYINFSTH